ncbi:MAG TPA: HypC/HybG/HupF family hydrogenase formation chaperone [Planctomycetes bacterium]|nr:HypC/HybG/HupF family hydrogenase formation chaperone [Planctomycetota bacterium]|tara:strand:- start:267 stop:527 length:261 start_codon:yes stop_codon:yes gene_type:complete
MCLAIPGQVETISERSGLRVGQVRFGGVTREAVLEHVPEVEVGDYVLVHVGFALQRVDEAEAQRTYALLRELGQLDELEPPSQSAP